MESSLSMLVKICQYVAHADTEQAREMYCLVKSITNVSVERENMVSSVFKTLVSYPLLTHHTLNKILHECLRIAPDLSTVDLAPLQNQDDNVIQEIVTWLEYENFRLLSFTCRSLYLLFQQNNKWKLFWKQRQWCCNSVNFKKLLNYQWIMCGNVLHKSKLILNLPQSSALRQQIARICSCTHKRKTLINCLRRAEYWSVNPGGMMLLLGLKSHYSFKPKNLYFITQPSLLLLRKFYQQFSTLNRIRVLTCCWDSKKQFVYSWLCKMLHQQYEVLNIIVKPSNISSNINIYLVQYKQLIFHHKIKTVTVSCCQDDIITIVKAIPCFLEVSFLEYKTMKIIESKQSSIKIDTIQQTIHIHVQNVCTFVENVQQDLNRVENLVCSIQKLHLWDIICILYVLCVQTIEVKQIFAEYKNQEYMDTVMKLHTCLRDNINLKQIHLKLKLNECDFSGTYSFSYSGLFFKILCEPYAVNEWQDISKYSFSIQWDLNVDIVLKQNICCKDIEPSSISKEYKRHKEYSTMCIPNVYQNQSLMLTTKYDIKSMACTFRFIREWLIRCILNKQSGNCKILLKLTS